MVAYIDAKTATFSSAANLIGLFTPLALQTNTRNAFQPFAFDVISGGDDYLELPAPSSQGFRLVFRPMRIRRRAERLADQLALPRLAFPGLIVRAPGDEAAAALASVDAFARLAREAWSWILRIRTPFHRHLEQRLRTPDAYANRLTGARMAALALAFSTFAWLSLGRQTWETGNWVVLAAAIPMTVTAGIPALVLVGGGVLLVVLLPALSVLLWPFGIFRPPRRRSSPYP